MENEEEKFRAYEEVRESGETNMFDVVRVMNLSNYVLNKADVVFIMRNYKDLAEKYL